MSASPPLAHYKVIYADPPWTFATYSRKGKGRSAEAHYGCMGFDDICAIPVADSVVRLQTNDQLLAETFWNHYHKDRDAKRKGVGGA